MIICDKNGVYRIHFASCMNITFNELRYSSELNIFIQRAK